MRVVVTTEQRFAIDRAGALWTTTGQPYSFWLRYLDVFDEVRIVGRAAAVDAPPAGARRVDGRGVGFVPLPAYSGPWGYVRALPELVRTFRGAVPRDAAAIVRLPSPIATRALSAMGRHPYGVELLGDPWDVFAPGAIPGKLRVPMRLYWTVEVRRQCRRAEAVAYVSGVTLPRRYPARRGVFTTTYSSIELGDDAFGGPPRTFERERRRARLVFVGSLEQMYKAPDVVIEAVARLAKTVDVELAMVGDGRHREELEALARRLGVDGRVRFVGNRPSPEAVRADLDAADLFVLPSRTEGLPRAMIEAMARGLPCIGSTVGGFPELLAREDLVPPSNVDALTKLLADVLASPARQRAMSARNVERAGAYRIEILRARRRAFYDVVRERTRAWLPRP
jgi:glycosyltransferase involved in cell wall biosynthesis